ncbi:MAG TPA: Gfo/Idh/MocA family oxidoreductase, partial [Pontiella sp.]
IGEVRSMEAEFCIHMNPFSLKMMPWHRMYSPRLAGGALLDLGIYPVTFARMVFGRSPSAITASADMAWTGVDKASRYSFIYPDGATAEMKTSFVEQSTRGLEIFGTGGSIHIPSFHSADHFTIKLAGTAPETVQCEPSGFQHEIREVHRCLEEGLTESPSMPLSETLENIQTLDAIRAQWGMTYPGE